MARLGYTQLTQAKARWLVQHGHTVRGASDRLGVSKSSVHNWVTQPQYKSRPKLRTPSSVAHHLHLAERAMDTAIFNLRCATRSTYTAQP
jgi:transposase